MTTNNKAIKALWTALNHHETLPANVKPFYAASYNFNVLVQQATVEGVVDDGQRSQLALDTLWAICARLQGLNVETLKRQRFHERQAALRKAAGISERKRKEVSVPDKSYLFCPNAIAAVFPQDEFLPAPRAEFWLLKNIRQECWLAARELVSNYSDSNRPYLLNAYKRATLAVSGAELNIVESALEGQPLTNGGFGTRKQFWKFVGYILDGILPKDLLVIIDIPKAIARETHYIDKVKVAA